MVPNTVKICVAGTYYDTVTGKRNATKSINWVSSQFMLRRLALPLLPEGGSPRAKELMVILGGMGLSGSKVTSEKYTRS